MFDDINSILEYEVDDPEYLQIINGTREIKDIINFNLLFEYMKEQNEEYCKKEGLCETCHTPLKEYEEYEEICGSRQISERYWSCPNHC